MGSPALSLEEAKIFATETAIQYMATDQRKVIKDYNFDALEEQEEINKHLRCKIEEKNKQLVEAIVACDLLIDQVTYSNKRIQDIVSENLHLGCAAMHGEHNAGFLRIQHVTTEIKYHEDEAMAKIKDTGAYPLREDSLGTQDANGDLRYNSDGEEYNEEEVLRYRRD